MLDAICRLSNKEIVFIINDHDNNV